jgi:hypothetical protein
MQTAVRLNFVPAGALMRSKLQQDLAGNNPARNRSRVDMGEVGAAAGEATGDCGATAASGTISAELAASPSKLPSATETTTPSAAERFTGSGCCKNVLFRDFIASLSTIKEGHGVLKSNMQQMQTYMNNKARRATPALNSSRTSRRYEQGPHAAADNTRFRTYPESRSRARCACCTRIALQRDSQHHRIRIVSGIGCMATCGETHHESQMPQQAELYPQHGPARMLRKNINTPSKRMMTENET